MKETDRRTGTYRYRHDRHTRLEISFSLPSFLSFHIYLSPLSIITLSVPVLSLSTRRRNYIYRYITLEACKKQRAKAKSAVRVKGEVHGTGKGRGGAGMKGRREVGLGMVN